MPMSDPSNTLMPRKLLLAIAALIGFTLVLVTVARLTGLGLSHVPPEPVAQSLDLRFEPRDDGALVVRAVADGTTIKVIAPDTEQFIRGVLRAAARDRRAHHAGADEPFQVARLTDGRYTLRDLATGRIIELHSFGPTNEGAFAALLTAGRPVATPPPTPATAAQTRQPG
jgi:putative photosynthetic complex assembly protein